MIRVSMGTAAVLRLKETKNLVDPTTAYVMIGEGCTSKCLFCAQSILSKTPAKMLSRVSWLPFPPSEIIKNTADSFEDGKIKRICLQVVNSPDIYEETVKFLAEIHKNSPIPVCVSANSLTLKQIGELKKRGMDKLGLPVDAASEKIFEKIKGRNWKTFWRYFQSARDTLGKSLTTHLIAGLGESEEEIASIMKEIYSTGVDTALFAFTPLRGTPLEKESPPGLSSYRRIQMAHYLIKKNLEKYIYFSKGLIKFNKKEAEIDGVNMDKIFAGGEAFCTSGCSFCNRPFYNERAGGKWYNFPRPLTEGEIKEAVEIAEKY